MMDGKNVFDQPVKNDLVTYESIQKIATGQGGDYTTGCLLDYNFFEKLLQDDSTRFKQTTSAWC